MYIHGLIPQFKCQKFDILNVRVTYKLLYSVSDTFFVLPGHVEIGSQRSRSANGSMGKNTNRVDSL